MTTIDANTTPTTNTSPTGRPPRAPDPALVDGQRVLIEAEVCAGGTKIHTIRPQQFGKIVYLDLAEVVVHRDLPVQAVMDRIDVTAAELRRQIDTIAGALNDGAPGWSQAMAATNARLRSQLAEAREQRDQAQRWNDEARRAWAVDSAGLAVVRGELAAAREAYQRLAEAAQTVADALEAVATGGILDSAGHLRDLLARALAATAPETAPESPQTDEQTEVRADTHTEAQTGYQGPLDLDAIRARWLHPCGPCDAGYPTGCTCPPGDPRTVIAALAAEIDRLRDGVLDLADRIHTHAKGYGELEDVAADFDGIAEELRTLTAGSTPDTGSTDEPA